MARQSMSGSQNSAKPSKPSSANARNVLRTISTFSCDIGPSIPYDLEVAMLDHYPEDAEYDFSAVFTDTKPHRGRESLRRQWEEMLETWEGVRMDPLDAFDLGGGRFVLS